MKVLKVKELLLEAMGLQSIWDLQWMKKMQILMDNSNNSSRKRLQKFIRIYHSRIINQKSL